MSNKHAVGVSIEIYCAHCGGPMEVCMAISDPSREKGFFDRDNPYERTDQKILVIPCECQSKTTKEISNGYNP